MSKPAEDSLTPAASPKLKFDEEEEESALVPTWGHYDNLAKMIFEVAAGKKKLPGGLKTLFATQVTATEKIDGSNLGILISFNPAFGIEDKKDPKAWEILLLQGRSAPLWKKPGFDISSLTGEANAEEKNDDEGEDEPKETDPKKLLAQAEKYMVQINALQGYGLAGSLKGLVPEMKNFAVKVANALNVTEIELFGEAFRGKRSKESINAKKEKVIREEAAVNASFHPFGYKLLKNKKLVLTRLIASTHQLFTSCVDTSMVASIPKTHDEFISLLFDAKGFVICPPPLYVAAKDLLTTIETVAPLLLNPPERAFEGVFLVAEEGFFGCKFKSGSHDEQGSILARDALGIPDDTKDDIEIRILAAHDAMTKIFKTKIPPPQKMIKAVVSNGANSEQKKMEQLLAADVEKATQREFSKILSFTNVDRSQRQPIIDQIVPNIIKEVLEIYTESQEELPYPEQTLKTKAPILVKALVLKVPYTPAGGAEETKKEKKGGDNDDDDDDQ